MSYPIYQRFLNWEEILFGVPQGSILGPPLFNIYLCDMFFELSQTDFAGYADDNTPYAEADYIDEVITILEMIQFSYLNGSLTTR